MNDAINQTCCWATDESASGLLRSFRREFESKGVRHWSRVFEYPWVMLQGRFGGSQIVLDAGGGGDGVILQRQIANLVQGIVSVDLDGPEIPVKDETVSRIRGNIMDLKGNSDCFDRVICVSVLEHIEWPGPIKAMNEMFRVLRPGGRLVLTFDVADSSRWNHSIDIAKAKDMLEVCFGAKIPMKPANILEGIFDELEPIAPGESKQVHLNVLCFACDKAIRV